MTLPAYHPTQLEQALQERMTRLAGLRLVGIQHDMAQQHLLLINDDAGHTQSCIHWREGMTVGDVLEELDRRWKEG